MGGAAWVKVRETTRADTAQEREACGGSMEPIREGEA